ncbi:MAG TPA: hypothetical protein DEQ64_21030 [Lachnoclostridium sp.]|nr:hypothetical protein [Lachnoclostridium sp.]
MSKLFYFIKALYTRALMQLVSNLIDLVSNWCQILFSTNLTFIKSCKIKGCKIFFTSLLQQRLLEKQDIPNGYPQGACFALKISRRGEKFRHSLVDKQLS